MGMWVCGMPDCPVCHKSSPLPPLSKRLVPHCSGEGAIYTPEYLARREGNAYGTQPDQWLHISTGY